MHVTIRSVELTTKLGSHRFVNAEHYHFCGIFLWIRFKSFFRKTKQHIWSESGQNLRIAGFMGSPDDNL